VAVRRLHILSILALGVGSTLALLSLFGELQTVSAAPAEFYVSPLGSDGPLCAQVAPCRTVQHAVDLAQDGDSIYVAQGVYTGVHTVGLYTQLVYLTKTVTVRGGYALDFSTWEPATYFTVLDAQQQGRVFYISGDSSPVIEGFYIVNGDAQAGGGSYGGGILAAGGSGPSLTVTLRHNVIAGNQAATGASGWGGGLSFVFSNAVLEDNVIAYNLSEGSGGGLRTEQTNAILRDNVIRYNQAGSSGGGIYLASLSSAIMTNTVLADNQAGFGGAGMVAAGAYVQMRHTTLARNHGGDGSGIYVVMGMFNVHSTLLMSNTIVADHTSGITVTRGNPMIGINKAILDGVLWYDNVHNYGGAGAITVTHEYTGDPAFASDGYHLLPTSAAIDRGLDAGVAFDIDGENRPAGGGPDLGVDELWWRVYLPLVLRGKGR
jgi:hypothetical protein